MARCILTEAIPYESRLPKGGPVGVCSTFTLRIFQKFRNIILVNV